MKASIAIICSVLLFFLISCNKNENELPNNEFTLSSDMQKGFSFETFGLITYDNLSGPIPDFVVLAQVNADGDVIAPFLSHPNYQNRFQWVEVFTDLLEAEEFFDSYSTPDNPQLLTNALNVRPYQIWLIQTNTGGYGKILVLETKIDRINDVPFAEVKFKAEGM